MSKLTTFTIENDKSFSMAQKISKNLSFIGENIKKIRLAKRISQADFAAIFKLARPSIGAYEEGRSEPKIDTIIQIANYFRLSIDILLTRELTVNDIYSFGLVREKLNKAHKLEKKEPQLLSKPIGIVKIDNYLNYIVQNKSSDFLEALPQISLPVLSGHRLRAFEMKGSEMEYHQQGIHHGDLLIGEWVETLETGSQQPELLTLVTKSGIINRRVTANKEKILLSADDPNYKEEVLEANDILEVWKIIAVFSTYLNPPTLLEERVLKLEKAMDDMKRNL